MASAETANLWVKLNLKDGLTRGIKDATRSLGNFDKGAGRVGKGVGQLGLGLARAGVVVGTAVVGGLAAAAKVGADFEAQLLTINTIARASEPALTKIGDGIRQLAREGRGDLSDLSAGYYDILSAGIAASDAQGVLEASSTLAIGGLSTTAQAVDLITTAINAYGQEASAASADADLFAKAIELGKVTADEIAGSFANVAPIAAQQGINIEEIAAAYAALTAQGTPAAEVTTQMSRAILDLLSPNKELNTLQKKTGKNFMAIAREKGLVVALQEMRDAVGGDEQAFKDLFGRVEGYKFALQTTGPQQEIYNKALLAMGDSAGTASEQMGERTKGLAFQVNRLKLNLIDAGIELSAGFLPALGRAADKLTKFLSDDKNRASLRRLGEDIGRAIDNVDWGRLLETAKGLASALQPALALVVQLGGLIANLPPGLLGAGAGLVVTNQLSGGLIGTGLGNIFGGLGEVLSKSILSRLPVIGKGFVQPVMVMNWPPGLPGGGGGGDILPKVGTFAGIVASMGGTAALVSVVASAIPALALLALPYIFKGPEGSGPKDLNLGKTTTGTNLGKLSWQTTGMAYGNSPGLYNLINQQGQKNASASAGNPTAAVIEEQRRTTGAIISTHLRSRQDSMQELAAEKQASMKLSIANQRLAAIQRKKTSFTSVTNVSIPITIRDIQNVQNKRRRIVKRNQLATI